MGSRTGRCEAGVRTFGHEALGSISSSAGSCVWRVIAPHRSVREWAIRRSWAGTAGAGAGRPDCGVGHAGGASRLQ
jgi:hypothetical protein